MRFLPSVCFSRSLRFRVNVAAVAFAVTSLRSALTVSRAMTLHRWRLDGDGVLLPGDDFLELGRQGASPALCLVAMDDAREGVNRFRR